MKTKFLTSLFLGVLAFHVLAGQTSGASSAAKASPGQTKQMAVKNPVVSGNSQKQTPRTMSIGGPAKTTKGTGEITGTAVAHKR